MSDLKITGTWVNLRSLNAEDADLTYKWRLSDRANLLSAAPKSIENQRDWIQNRPPNEHNFIIELAGSGAPVGMLSLVSIDTEAKIAETGRFLIGEPEKVVGIPAAVEAMLLLYQFAFGQLDLYRLYGIVSSENSRMIKWQLYFGMKIEGTWREHLSSKDGRRDAVLFGLLRPEYELVTKPKLKKMMAIAQGSGRK
jgi:RimJ/RimL family protein N-acetyltransferase